MMFHRGLIRSSSSSGDTQIFCPAYMCREKLTMSDVAHLLVKGRNEAVDENDIHMLMKLTEFKINDMLIERKYTHCSTPSCNRMLKPNPIVKALSNKVERNTMCFCDCGAMTCWECGEPYHFGLSCEAAKRVRKEIETGNINSELQR